MNDDDAQADEVAGNRSCPAPPCTASAADRLTRLTVAASHPLTAPDMKPWTFCSSSLAGHR
jgi:hypothetical protein